MSCFKDRVLRLQYQEQSVFKGDHIKPKQGATRSHRCQPRGEPAALADAVPLAGHPVMPGGIEHQPRSSKLGGTWTLLRDPAPRHSRSRAPLPQRRARSRIPAFSPGKGAGLCSPSSPSEEFLEHRVALVVLQGCGSRAGSTAPRSAGQGWPRSPLLSAASTAADGEAGGVWAVGFGFCF